ncbi:hypothetical protein ADEAN_000253200 [Angomonas deanei]|uniref:Uncharacterized protein n=1 Tax=Angomonas deanei TaxID=59799 RepID=A0A7G2C696_9TRYP|nr:hypothetical protein ADEAN_000253200 [Angomonas deanei]
MPTCPDCGQLCESPYHLQQHRMNCVMANRNLYNNTNNSNPNNRGNNTNNNNNRNSGGVTTPLPALNGNRYNNGNPNFYSPQSEIDQMLALQQARQEEERIQTERMLLEQQVNLVLPARQAELHQTQEYLKNQITQLKMNLLAQQQFAGQQNNMEVELLRNELAAVRNQLNALGGAATPPPGVSNSSFTPLPYNNSWPMQNNNNNNSPAPNEYGLKNVKSREPTKPTKSKANQRRKEKDTRRPKKDNRSARHRRRYEEDSPEEDYSDTEEDSYDDSDESEDSMDYDDLYDDYLPPRRHHRGRPSERRRSRTADHNGHDGRGDGRRSMSAGARSVESAPIARSKKNIYEFLNNVSPEGQADPLLSVLHSMKQELDALRGQQNDQMAVPFPTSSTT